MESSHTDAGWNRYCNRIRVYHWIGGKCNTEMGCMGLFQLTWKYYGSDMPTVYDTVGTDRCSSNHFG